MSIKLSEPFERCPQGHYKMIIEEVEYNEDFGKVNIKLRTEDNHVVNQRFGLKNQDGSVNSGAMNMFSWLARAALGNQVFEIEPMELIGHYIEADVKHTEVPKRDNPDETTVFINLTNYASSEGFDTPDTDIDEVLA